MDEGAHTAQTDVRSQPRWATGGGVERVQTTFGAWRTTGEQALAEPRARRLATHDDIEVTFVFRGSIQVFVGASLVRISAGRMALMWAGLPHVLADAEPATDFAVIHIPLNWFLAWETSDDVQNRVLRGEVLVEPDERHAASDEIAVSRWVADVGSGDAGRADCASLEIEARVRRLAAVCAQAGPAEDRRPRSRIHFVTDHIAAHLNEPLAVEQLAAVADLNAKYLMTLFRQSLGMTLWDYVRRLRVAQAQRLLVTTDLAVAQIADACGFGSESQFYATFRRFVNETPQAYRNRNRLRSS